MSDNYNPANWYWVVAGSSTQVYSSAAAAYVPVSNGTYTAWLANGNTPTPAPTEQDLWNVLAPVYPQGIPIGNTAGQETIALQRTFNDNYFTLRHYADTTKKVRWLLSGIATGQMRTITVPDSDLTLVGRDTTQTLSNKTFSDGIKSTSKNAAHGIGYATGAGASVVQANSKSDFVSCNGMCGKITTHNASMANGAVVGFTWQNTSFGPSDVIIIHPLSGATSGAYNIWISAQDGVYANVIIRNISGGALAEAIVLGFAVIKAVQA